MEDIRVQPAVWATYSQKQRLFYIPGMNVPVFGRGLLCGIAVALADGYTHPASLYPTRFYSKDWVLCERYPPVFPERDCATIGVICPKLQEDGTYAVGVSGISAAQQSHFLAGTKS